MKSKKLAKSKKSWKNKNLLKLAVKKIKLDFVIFGTKMAFNCLWLAFTKALILWYFNPKYYILIKTNISNYIIKNKLNQLTYKTNLNKVVI